MNGKYLTNVLVFLMFWVSLSCTSSRDNQEDLPSGQSPETLTGRRDDGSMSSINQVDENHMVHGIRVTFYGDGKAIRLRRSFNHGIRNGPSIRYYQNGQISEHINFKEGEKHGPARKYYRNGALMAELEYDNGFVLPG